MVSAWFGWLSLASARKDAAFFGQNQHSPSHTPRQSSNHSSARYASCVFHYRVSNRSVDKCPCMSCNRSVSFVFCLSVFLCMCLRLSLPLSLRVSLFVSVRLCLCFVCLGRCLCSSVRLGLSPVCLSLCFSVGLCLSLSACLSGLLVFASVRLPVCLPASLQADLTAFPPVRLLPTGKSKCVSRKKIQPRLCYVPKISSFFFLKKKQPNLREKKNSPIKKTGRHDPRAIRNHPRATRKPCGWFWDGFRRVRMALGWFRMAP